MAIAMSCPGLVSLELKSWHVAWAEPGPMFEPLSACSRLEDVKLGYMYGLGDDQVGVALQSLQHLPSLKTLEVCTHISY